MCVIVCCIVCVFGIYISHTTRIKYFLRGRVLTYTSTVIPRHDWILGFTRTFADPLHHLFITQFLV